MRRILVVEDDERTRSFIELLLVAEGHAVRAVAHAGQATTQIVDFEPHLILMDIRLPEIGGLELTRRLKADPYKRHIPIVAMTAFGKEYHRDTALAAGCAAYIAKPFRPEALLALVEAHALPPVPEGNVGAL